MGVIGTVFLAVFSILGAVVVKLLADEAKAWLPRIVERLIDQAVKRLPAKYRERFAEEWRSHIDDIPGDLAKFYNAFGCIFASVNIRWASLTKSDAPMVPLQRAFAAVLILFELPVFGIIALILASANRKPFIRVRRKDATGRRVAVLMFNTRNPVGGIATFCRHLDRSGLSGLPALIDIAGGAQIYPKQSVQNFGCQIAEMTPIERIRFFLSFDTWMEFTFGIIQDAGDTVD